jgi:uncharacterized membrane protein YoaK (UPF0700 family)
MTETPAPPAVSRSPLPWLLILLSVTTGLVDAVSVLGLGKVFTANMTGNVVFLGLAMAHAPGFTPAPFLAAIAAFMVGAASGARIGRFYTGRPLRNWLILSALVETLLFWTAAAIAPGIDIAAQTPDANILAIVVLTALAMGFRNATIRQLKIPDLTTTVLTMTITGLAADTRLAGGQNGNWQRRIGSVLSIFAGAAIGGCLVLASGLVLPLLLAGALVLAGSLACALHSSAAQPYVGQSL